MKNLTSSDYDQMVQRASPPSKSGRNIALAFVFGGAICMLGEGLIHLFVRMGSTLETAQTAA
jgi:stage V sporulation protein AC